MTAIELAEISLDELEKTPPAMIFAGRRGICAFWRNNYANVIGFRRKDDGRVFLEWHQGKAGKQPNRSSQFTIPDDLAKRAAVILDSIP
jgi:hypothetical protein